MNLLLRDQIIFIERFLFLTKKHQVDFDVLNRVTPNDFLKGASEIISRRFWNPPDTQCLPVSEKTWYLKKNNPNIKALPVVAWALLDRGIDGTFEIDKVLMSISTYLKTELDILGSPKTSRGLLRLFNGISHLTRHSYSLIEMLELMRLHIPYLKPEINKALDDIRTGRGGLHEIFRHFDLPPFVAEALYLANYGGTVDTTLPDLIYHLMLEVKIVNQSISIGNTESA